MDVFQLDVTGPAPDGYAPDAMERIDALPDFEVSLSLQPASAEDLERSFGEVGQD